MKEMSTFVNDQRCKSPSYFFIGEIIVIYKNYNCIVIK